MGMQLIGRPRADAEVLQRRCALRAARFGVAARGVSYFISSRRSR